MEDKDRKFLSLLIHLTKTKEIKWSIVFQHNNISYSVYDDFLIRILHYHGSISVSINNFKLDQFKIDRGIVSKHDNKPIYIQENNDKDLFDTFYNFISNSKPYNVHDDFMDKYFINNREKSINNLLNEEDN